jgi:hypothetical protein
MEEQNKSIGWVVAMLAIVVLYAGWAFMAADYFQHNPDSGGGEETNFFVNSVAQLPRFPGVMSHAIANRLWLIILIAFLEAVVFLLWIFMRKLERELGTKKRR